MSFPQFSLLPPELQLRIWAFSLPPPRVVDLFAVPISESLQPRFVPAPKKDAASSLTSLRRPLCDNDNEDETSNDNEGSISSDSDGDEEEVSGPMLIAPVWIRTFIERVYTSRHDIRCLHVCKDARKAVLREYSKLDADMELKGEMVFKCLENVVQGDGNERMYCLASLKGERPYALLDPRRDIVFLQDPPQMVNAIGGFVLSSLEILLRWLDTSIIQSLRRLAIPYYTWHKTRNTVGLRLLFEFEALEELYVSFLGGSFEGRRRRRENWSDVVGGLWSHVNEVEEEVMADVEGLKRSYPGWKAPRVRVVRHRGMLIEGIEG